MQTRKGLKPICNSLLEKVGNTPLVKLKHLSKKYSCEVYGKLESFNPTMSIKDRVVKYIVEQAEKCGDLKPDMTIVDATSGNTGLSIAFIALLKGYKCILTVKDNSAKAKIEQLQLYGARVIKCPASVKPDNPLSYYSVAQKIVEQEGNCFFLNQNHNQNHFKAHYNSTGKEIWEQTEGNISHFFASASTGGTISGVGAFLKDQNTNIKIICADSKGSVLKPYHEKGIYYKDLKRQTPLEGVGKDIIPSVFKKDIITECFEVDNESSIQNIKDLLQQEGIFAGGSSGAAIDAFIQFKEKYPNEKIKMAILNFPDYGIKYMDKLYKCNTLVENAENVIKQN